MPNVFIKGKGKKTLNKNDFVGSGGQGKIYAKDSIAYKIYTDPSQVIPEGKINELGVLTDNNIIRPIDILMDDTNKPIGYTMRYVDNIYALCQIFNKIFKQKNNISPQTILDLVQKMQVGVQHIHNKDILIVDCNEMNFLVNHQFNEIFFIDVDSYQTPHYKANAIMESIRDRHCKNNNFTKETDWFSWGIVTFQMFIGIHPYKGKHPSIADMNDRMLKNVSVFNKDVNVPRVCEPLTNIPQAYRDWYKAVFEDGKRISPPSSAMPLIAIITKVDKIVGSNKFDIQEIKTFTNIGNITNVIYSFGARLVQAEKGAYLNSSLDKSIKPNTEIGFTPQMNHCVAATVVNGRVSLTDVNRGVPIDNLIAASQIMSYDGRFYIKDNDVVSEIEFVETPNKLLATSKVVANILEKATRFYDGVMIQNLLGAAYVSVFPASKIHYQIRMKELEDYKIIDAKYERGVLMVVGGDKSGKYDRFVFRFDTSHKEYDIRIEKDISHSGLNFTVLDNLSCIHIDENEKVNVFKATKGDQRLTLIDDPAITSDMQLYRWGAQVVAAKGDVLYSVKMK